MKIRVLFLLLVLPLAAGCLETIDVSVMQNARDGMTPNVSDFGQVRFQPVSYPSTTPMRVSSGDPVFDFGGGNTRRERRFSRAEQFFVFITHVPDWYSDGRVYDDAVVREAEVQSDNIAFFQHFLRFVRDAVHHFVIDRDTERRGIRPARSLGRVAEEAGRVAALADELFCQVIKFHCRDAGHHLGAERRKHAREALPSFN